MNKKVHLTPRELQVLKLISKGNQRKFIAARLKISINTVSDHIRNLHLKTDSHLYPELVVWGKDYFEK